MHQYAASHGLLAPNVYQGNYIAVSRTTENTLFPILRKYGMAFYPLAGGFLCKSVTQMEEAVGRWSTANPPDALYLQYYRQSTYMHALAIWNAIADDAGILKSHLACRWMMWHSPLDAGLGDAFVLGASKLHQVEQIMRSTREGPLEPSIVARIGSLWDMVKEDAPPAEFYRG